MGALGILRSTKGRRFVIVATLAMGALYLLPFAGTAYWSHRFFHAIEHQNGSHDLTEVGKCKTELLRYGSLVHVLPGLIACCQDSRSFIRAEALLFIMYEDDSAFKEKAIVLLEAVLRQQSTSEDARRDIIDALSWIKSAPPQLEPRR